jgi:acyl carrier protein
MDTVVAGRAPAASGPLDPRTEARLVWRVARQFAACLELPQITIRARSDFFSLGGDSLSIADLLARLEDELGVLLDADAVVAAPTPEAMARHIHDRTHDRTHDRAHDRAYAR